MRAPNAGGMAGQVLEFAAKGRDARIADALRDLGKRAGRTGEQHFGGVKAHAAYLLEDAGACDLPEKLFGEAS